MQYFVTGGGGFLGSHLAKALLARGDQVRVFGRHEYPDMIAAGADCRVGDIRDYECVRDACRGCDGVFHVAALAGIWGAREDFFSINVKGTANSLRACLENKISRLVFTSSPSVVYDMKRLDIEDGDENLPYPKTFAAVYPESKARAEKMVLDANGWEMVVGDDGRSAPVIQRLATCSLRPHLIWGVGDPHLVPRIVQRGRQNKLRIIGAGGNKISLTHVGNAVDAHVRAMDALAADSALAGQAYFINDPEPVVMWDWINDLLRRTGCPEVKKRIPYRLAWGIGALLEGVHSLFPALGEPRMTRFVAAQMAGSHWFSIAKAQKDFGYNPRQNLESDIQTLVDELSVVTCKA